MKAIDLMRHAALIGLTLALFCVASSATAACSEGQFCSETSTFVAQLTDFRTSTQGSVRVGTATLRFQNRGSQPLTLAYVSGSGVLIDDQGNRYSVDDYRNRNAVRAIGIIARSTFDPKFVVDFLRVFDSATAVSLNLNDANSAALFTAEENHQYVVMPLARE